MILHIEYYKGDTYLTGRKIGVNELQKQIEQTKLLYDAQNDNFSELFCRMFDWSIVGSEQFADYTYDRDTERLYKTIYR